MTNFNERIAALDRNPFAKDAIPLLREMQAEIDRLREGLKTMDQNFAEMEKLRSQFYTEKEQAETALLFANREVDRLHDGIKKIKERIYEDSCYIQPVYLIYKLLEALQNYA